MFKIIVESLNINRFGKSITNDFVMLSKPAALRKAAVLAQHSCVEIVDPCGQVIALGDPIIGFKEVEKNEHI